MAYLGDQTGVFTALDGAGRLTLGELAAKTGLNEKYLHEWLGSVCAAGYINYYVCNGAVIGPEFGDPRADAAAKATMERLFPGRAVVQINIDGIAAGGGGIHCTTQQEPR